MNQEGRVCLGCGQWYGIWYIIWMAINATEARRRLFPLIEQVNNDRRPVEILSRRGNAVLLSREDYEALEETANLLRSPANARRLLDSLDQAQRREREEHSLSR